MRAHRRVTRGVALVAVLALVVGVVSDAVGGHFWERHGLIAGVTGSFIVVVLSVAIVNEAVEHRRRERWKVLAVYVLFQLILNARLIWTGVAELTGNMQSGARTASVLDDGSRIVRDTTSLTQSVADLLSDSERRGRLQEQLADLVTNSEEVFGRWAGLMLTWDLFAEVIDRHVELASYGSWLDSLLDATSPANQGGSQSRTTRSHAHPAVQFEGDIEDELLVSRIVTITQLAEELDRGTLRFALTIVPLEWWAERLEVTPVMWTGEAGASSAVPATVW